MKLDMIRVAAVILVVASGVGVLLTSKNQPISSAVPTEFKTKLQDALGFYSEQQREALFRLTEAKLQKLYEVGLAVVELEEKKIEIVTKKNMLGFQVTAVMAVKWKAQYKFGVDLEQGWELQFQGGKLTVIIPGIELLSAQLRGPLKGEIIDRGWGINERKRLQQLTETIPEVLQERGESMANQRDVELLVAHEVEKHLREIIESSNMHVEEIIVLFRTER